MAIMMMTTCFDLKTFLKSTHRPPSDDHPLHRQVSPLTKTRPLLLCLSVQLDNDLSARLGQVPAALQRWVGRPLGAIPELPPVDRRHQLVRVLHLGSQGAGNLTSHLCRDPPIVADPDYEKEWG